MSISYLTHESPCAPSPTGAKLIANHRMPVSGPQILARTLSKTLRTDMYGNAWNYHSRSDHHSKVGCWAIVFDLLRSSALFRRHADEGRVAFGINHEMRDFAHDRKKDLDLVICLPASNAGTGRNLKDLARHYSVDLTRQEQAELEGLPPLKEGAVGSVLVALEAKACMTEHQKALPRFYDELNSSHQTIHGAHDSAIAAGLAMVNIADRFLSPGRNQRLKTEGPHWTNHKQPFATAIAIDKVKQLPRRSQTGTPGYDALGIVVIDCANDGSPVSLHSKAPAPQVGDNYHYVTMLDRLRGIYDTRFAQI